MVHATLKCHEATFTQHASHRVITVIRTAGEGFFQRHFARPMWVEHALWQMCNSADKADHGVLRQHVGYRKLLRNDPTLHTCIERLLFGK